MARPFFLNSKNMKEKILLIVSDPAVMDKMADYIKKNSTWDPEAHPRNRAGQCVRIMRGLTKATAERNSRYFQNTHHFDEYQESDAFHFDAIEGMIEQERRNGFHSFDDEETSHFGFLGTLKNRNVRGTISGILKSKAAKTAANWLKTKAGKSAGKLIKRGAGLGLKGGAGAATGGIGLVLGASKGLLKKKPGGTKAGNALRGLFKSTKGGSIMANSPDQLEQAYSQIGPVRQAVMAAGIPVADEMEAKAATAQQAAVLEQNLTAQNAQLAALKAGAPSELVNQTISQAQSPEQATAALSKMKELYESGSSAPDVKTGSFGSNPGMLGILAVLVIVGILVMKK